MSSTAAFVVRIRLVIAAAFKLIGVVVLLTGLLGPLVSWVVEGVVDGDFFDMGYYLGRVIWGGTICAVGLAMVLVGERCARLIVRVPADVCPKCRFNLESFRADRCPECGLYLGEDFHAPPPVHTAPQVSRTDVQSPPAASQE